jgi:hypothetical protein
MSLTFNGTTQYLSSPGDLGIRTYPFTVAALVNPANTNAWKGLLSNGNQPDTTQDGFGVELDASGGVYFQSGAQGVAAGTYVANAWQLIVAVFVSRTVQRGWVYNFSTRSLAVGAAAATFAVTVPPPTSGVILGSWYNAGAAPTDFFNGSIAWAGVWNTDLAGGLTSGRPQRINDLIVNGPWRQSMGADCKFFMPVTRANGYYERVRNFRFTPAASPVEVKTAPWPHETERVSDRQSDNTVVKRTSQAAVLLSLVSGVVLPRRYSTQKPTPAIQVDSANPLARGLLFSANPGSTSRIDQVSGAVGVLDGGSDWNGVTRIGDAGRVLGTSNNAISWTVPPFTLASRSSTIAGWVNIDSVGLFTEVWSLAIVGSTAGTKGDVYWGTDGSSTSARFYWENSNAILSSAFFVTGLHHYAVTTDTAGTATFYRDGVALGTGSQGATNSRTINTIRFGGHDFNDLQGQCPTFALWNRPLTPGEVMQHYTAPYSLSAPTKRQFVAAVAAMVGGVFPRLRNFSKKVATAAPVDKSVPLTRNLEMYLPFVESGGPTAHNISGTGGTGRDGTLSADGMWTTGPFGMALDFNNVAATPRYLNIGTNHNLPTGVNQPYSFSWWFYQRSWAATEAFFITDGYNNNVFKIENSNVSGEFLWYRYNGADFQAGYGGTLPLNTWHHVVIIDDGLNTASSVKMYWNGKPMVVGIATPGTGRVAFDAYGVGIGWRPPFTADGPFDGKMADVMIWSRALTDSEAKQLYAAPFSVMAPRPSAETVGIGTPGTGTAPVGPSVVVKILAMAGSAGASVRRQIGSIKTTSRATTASVIRQVGKFISFSASSAVTATFLKVILKLLTSTGGSTAAFLRQVGKSLSTPSQASNASVVKQAAKSVSLTGPSSTSLLKRMSALFTTPASSVGTLLKRSGKSFVSTAASAVTVTKFLPKTFQVGQASVSSLLKLLPKLLATAGSSAVTVSPMKVLLKLLAVASGSATSVSRRTAKAFTAVSSTAASTFKGLTKLLTNAIGTAYTFSSLKNTATTLLTLAYTATSNTTVGRRIGKLLAGVTSTTSSTVRRALGLTRAIPVSTAPIVLKGLSRLFTATSSSVVTFTRLNVRLVLLALTAASNTAIVRQVRPVLAIPATAAVALGKGIAWTFKSAATSSASLTFGRFLQRLLAYTAASATSLSRSKVVALALQIAVVSAVALGRALRISLVVQSPAAITLRKFMSLALKSSAGSAVSVLTALVARLVYYYRAMITPTPAPTATITETPKPTATITQQ